MSNTKIYATVEDGSDTLVISGPVRLLNEVVRGITVERVYEPDEQRCIDALLALFNSATHKEALTAAWMVSVQVSEGHGHARPLE